MTDQTKAGLEAVAWMWQHDETGRIGFTDQWQIDNGFAAGNPRLRIIAHLIRQSDAAAIIAGKDAEIVRLTKENKALAEPPSRADCVRALLYGRKIDELQATTAQQAERIAELERSTAMTAMRDAIKSAALEENERQAKLIAAQSAALAKARSFIDEWLETNDPANHQSHCECDPDAGYQCAAYQPPMGVVVARTALAAIDALGQPEDKKGTENES